MQAGGSGLAMTAELNRMGRLRAFGLYAEWTDRIRDGEVPLAPPRLAGRERTVVLTMWGWGHEQGMAHDEVATDKRNPTLYANGPIYGVGEAGLVLTDPVTHALDDWISWPTSRSSHVELLSGEIERDPSLYWGTERADLRSCGAHNPIMDDKGGSGSPRRSAPRRSRAGAREDRITGSRSTTRSCIASPARFRTTIRNRRSSS